MVAATIDAGHGITAIDTEYIRPGLDASHLVVDAGRAAFVDTGPNSAVPLLLDALDQQGLDPADVDWLFLTHVHLDHAGGAGLLMQQLPNARCVLHPRGAPHMADPSKLVAGTEAVYGRAQARAMYGDIVPIDVERIDEAGDEQVFELGARRMLTLHTEGHARHHYCIHDADSAGVFTGDSFGISYRELDTRQGPFIFPSTTPPHFDPVEAHRSVDRILALRPERLYLTHFSAVTDVERLGADMHRSIDAFVSIALACNGLEDRDTALKERLFEHLAERLEAHGFAGGRDAMWPLLEADVILNGQGLAAWLDWRAKHGNRS